MSSKLKDRKNKLRDESDRYEESLSTEFAEFKEKAGDIAGKAILIGGSALLSFLVIRAIVGKDKEQDDKEEIKERVVIKSTSQNVLLKSITDKAALVLLELAREMVMKIINNLPEKNEEEDL